MPKKRQQFRFTKPHIPTSPASSSANGSDRSTSTKSVNDILATLRRSSAASPSSRDLAGNTPSVPPAIREILQIPETPAPVPRRPARPPRFDQSGRRLPPGPPPPRSWVSTSDGAAGSHPRAPRLSPSLTWHTPLPGTYLPARGSLIDLAFRKLALAWDFQRVYNLYHLYYLPNHLKPVLIHFLGLLHDCGVSLSDLKLILLPPAGIYGHGEVDDEAPPIREMTHLDLSGSLGHSIRLKELSDLLFPAISQDAAADAHDSWDVAAEQITGPPPSRGLLPNLTHVSLSLNPRENSGGSWKQLLAFASKASGITHLSLAYWPDPCLTPRARLSSVATPQGVTMPYAGTNYYSHSLDHDWSEALLVLRMLSRNMYELEYLDLTGCAPWFPALLAESDHDFVDWAGSWGKIDTLRLCMGWRPEDDASTAEREAYRRASEVAARIERHIVAMRAGQGRFVTVERDPLE